MPASNRQTQLSGQTCATIPRARQSWCCSLQKLATCCGHKLQTGSMTRPSCHQCRHYRSNTSSPLSKGTLHHRGRGRGRGRGRDHVRECTYVCMCAGVGAGAGAGAGACMCTPTAPNNPCISTKACFYVDTDAINHGTIQPVLLAISYLQVQTYNVTNVGAQRRSRRRRCCSISKVWAVHVPGNQLDQRGYQGPCHTWLVQHGGMGVGRRRWKRL